MTSTYVKGGKDVSLTTQKHRTVCNTKTCKQRYNGDVSEDIHTCKLSNVRQINIGEMVRAFTICHVPILVKL